MPDKIAFITYETPFAPCGGIAAVLGRLPGYLQEASGLECVVVTPYHHNISKTTSLDMGYLGSTTVQTGTSEVRVHIHRYDDKWPYYFLRPESDEFFGGMRHPYDAGQTAGDITSRLVRDSLFFGAATVSSLRVIDPDATWILMMQDWEAATTVLALPMGAYRFRPFLTLHNSYDSGGLSDGTLFSAGMDAGRFPGPRGSSQATVLERILPTLSGPVFTVSRQFALDLVEDAFQAKVMAPHLEYMLRSKLIGVDNGPFSDLEIPWDMLEEGRRRNFAPLQEWKWNKRAAAIEALENHIPTADQPVWGDITRFRKDAAPWFVLAGRDDPRQKGYDVSALAVSRFLEEGGNARFFFFPIPGDEGLPGLSFLERLAGRFPESVIALPFIFQAGYFAILQGASYGVMPSLYEPFGMANEFYLKGTVGMGRATGGIIQQIVPMRQTLAFNLAVHWRAERWHAGNAAPTGILFREQDGIPSTVHDWRGINDAGYDKMGGHPDRVDERARYYIFQEMAGKLKWAIGDAARIFENDPQTYYGMLVEGIDYIRRSFSWERAAREYMQGIGL